MILQELVHYYDRQRATPGSDIAPPGWVRRPIDYLVEIHPDGATANLITTHVVEKGKRIGRSALLPAIGKQALKHTNSGKDANLLWDNASFVLGWQDTRETKLRSFIETIETWMSGSGVNDEGVRAVLSFLRKLSQEPESAKELITRFGALEDFEQRDPILGFQLVGDAAGPVHWRPAVTEAYSARLSESNDEVTLGNCLLTGSRGVPLADNETVIKNVWGAQTSGANLISFNAPSFISYGKQDRNGENAPVGKASSFAYSTALNHLLGPGSRNRVQVGDASTVFWADRPTAFPTLLSDLLGEDKDDPDRGTKAVQALLLAIHTGLLPVAERDVQFFVLGLAPNAARISVRFWLQAPLAELAPRVLQHFQDLRVVRRYEGDPLTPSLFRLLSSLALQGKLDNVPPRLAGEWMRAILEGRPHPAGLLNAAVIRCKAEQDVTYLRAAVLKAWLNREHRRLHPDLPLSHAHFKEALDMEQDNIAYRLGRLFALLERIQQQAQPGINATIRDRYFGAASTSPVSVFSTLLRLKNAHLKKLSEGQTVHYERLIGEVLATVIDFPRQLNLQDQGRFALGYYHQRQSFYTRKDPGADPSSPETPKED